MRSQTGSSHGEERGSRQTPVLAGVQRDAMRHSVRVLLKQRSIQLWPPLIASFVRRAETGSYDIICLWLSPSYETWILESTP